jgi:hypothetical protein
MTMTISECQMCDLEGTTECICCNQINDNKQTRFQDACCLATAGLLVVPFALMWGIASGLGWFVDKMGGDN